jgi:hypothetical protein
LSINLGDFISHSKREGTYGNVAIPPAQYATDQPTIDILASINKRATRIWARADWKWSQELLAFNITPAVRQYSVLAVSGNPIDRIKSLIPYDKTGTYLRGAPIRERTIESFYSKLPEQRDGTPCTANVITDYCNIGQDAAGNWNVIVYPLPNIASKMGGYAKAVLYTYLMADVVANIPIKYFPNGVVLDSLYEGVMSDIAKIRGQDVEAIRLDQSFEAKVKRLVGEQIGVATDNSPITTALPATVNRMRGRR